MGAWRWRALFIGSVLCLAPVPGDVGGCGQPLQDLDPLVFFPSKKQFECERCTECAIGTATCQQACDQQSAFSLEFPAGCYPLVHDGEACLRAILEVSCSDVELLMSDEHPRAPTECNFCPAREP